MAQREQNTAGLVPDDHVVLQDLGDPDPDNLSDTTSLAASILAFRQENGRTYHAYKAGTYVLPNDQLEKDRLDLQHNLLLATFDGKLHCAPLSKSPGRVLDAGCGTGIWSIEFADEHPDSKVTGVDLSPIQPAFVPPNVQFFVDDLEDEWQFEAPFDFIFSRFMTGSIRDWPRYMKQCYDALSPGGTLELIDIIYPLTSSDNSLTPSHALHKWSNLLNQAFASNGAPLDTALKYAAQLSQAGFTDIVQVKEKWPTNVWARGRKYKQIGAWAYENAVQALESLSLAVFTRPKDQGGLGWSVEELGVLLDGVRRELGDLESGVHPFWEVYSVYARKPE